MIEGRCELCGDDLYRGDENSWSQSHCYDFQSVFWNKQPTKEHNTQDFLLRKAKSAPLRSWELRTHPRPRRSRSLPTCLRSSEHRNKHGRTSSPVESETSNSFPSQSRSRPQSQQPQNRQTQLTYLGTISRRKGGVGYILTQRNHTIHGCSLIGTRTTEQIFHWLCQHHRHKTTIYTNQFSYQHKPRYNPTSKSMKRDISTTRIGRTCLPKRIPGKNTTHSTVRDSCILFTQLRSSQLTGAVCHSFLCQEATLHEVNHGGYVPSVRIPSSLPSSYKHTIGSTNSFSQKNEEISLKTFLYPLCDPLVQVFNSSYFHFPLKKVQNWILEVGVSRMVM